MAGIATLRDDLWTANYNFLQTGTYAISTENIYSSYNDKLISDVGLPLVIINKPNISREVIGMGVDPDEIIKGYLKIDIYNSSAESCKTISDEISNKYDTGGRTNLSNGWYFKNYDDEESDAEEESNKKYHKYSLNIIFVKG